MDIPEQKISLKELQIKVDNWIKSHGGYWSPLAMLASITEELGEIAREINHLEGYKPKKPSEEKGNIGGEIADMLFSIICIANYYKIDLPDEFNNSINKYSERDKNRF